MQYLYTSEFQFRQYIYVQVVKVWVMLQIYFYWWSKRVQLRTPQIPTLVELIFPSQQFEQFVNKFICCGSIFWVFVDLKNRHRENLLDFGPYAFFMIWLSIEKFFLQKSTWTSIKSNIWWTKGISSQLSSCWKDLKYAATISTLLI